MHISHPKVKKHSCC